MNFFKSIQQFIMQLLISLVIGVVLSQIVRIYHKEIEAIIKELLV